MKEVMVLEKTLGESLPVSIGTAVSLEKLFVNEDIKYDAVWFNLRTLFRNFWGSCVTPDLHGIKTLSDSFMEDVKELGIALGNQDKAFMFYIGAETEKLKSRFPDANLKIPKTIKQIHQNTMERNILTFAAEELGEKYCKIFSTKLIGPQDKKVLIMTHRVLDLLSQYEFGTLTLLESHTGALKGPLDWNTKLNNKPYNMPVNILSIQVLGDKQQFGPMKKDIVTSFNKLAEDKNWSPSTTMKKINDDLKNERGENISLFKKLAAIKLG